MGRYQLCRFRPRSKPHGLSRAWLVFPLLPHLTEKETEAQKSQLEELGSSPQLLPELSSAPSVVSWGKPHPQLSAEVKKIHIRTGLARYQPLE